MCEKLCYTLEGGFWRDCIPPNLSTAYVPLLKGIRMDAEPQPSWSLLTRLVHEGERIPAPKAAPTATPIYTTATYLYESAAALDAAFETGEGYIYSRYGNPTVGALE